MDMPRLEILHNTRAPLCWLGSVKGLANPAEDSLKIGRSIMVWKKEAVGLHCFANPQQMELGWEQGWSTSALWSSLTGISELGWHRTGPKFTEQKRGLFVCVEQPLPPAFTRCS